MALFHDLECSRFVAPQKPKNKTMVIFLIKSYFNKCFYKFKCIYSLRKQGIQNDKNFTNHGSNYMGITSESVCKHIVSQYLLKTCYKW